MKKEFRERADAQQVAHRKALEEQKGLYEKRIREMHEEFNRCMHNVNARTAEMIENLTGRYNANRKARDAAETNLNDSAERQHEDAAENQLKMSRSERVARLKANQDEIERLIKANPGCVLVPSDKQARILETRFATSAQRRYCDKNNLKRIMEGGKPMFGFGHSTDGAGKSFVLRLKVKGMNLVGVVSWSSRIR